MKKHITNGICLLLALVFCLSAAVPVYAEDMPRVTVRAYSDATEQLRPLTLLDYQGTAYINATDALILSGYENHRGINGGILYEFGAHKVAFRGDGLLFAGAPYYPLKELMDALSTRYYFDEAAGTLIFLTCDSYYENLLSDCTDVFLDGYELNFYKGTGWQLASAYEIIAGLRFIDLVIGKYDQDHYEQAIAGIIAESDESALATLKDGNSVMSKLSTLLDFAQTDINGLETYGDLFGTDLDGVIEAYSILNGLIPGVSIKDAVGILEYVEDSAACGEVYPNAVKYGLANNANIHNRNLIEATKRVYNYYDTNKPTHEAVISSLLYDVGTGIVGEIPVGELTADLLKEAVGSSIYINSAYIKLAKLIFDELGMKERTTAVMQTVFCRNIQQAAIEQFLKYRTMDYEMDDPEKGEIAKTIKYSTILHLRACQYAYSLYEFDDDPGVAFSTQYWKEKTTAAITNISAYSDEELSMIVDNETLSLDGIQGYLAPENEGAAIPLDLFDGTYWSISFGFTIAANYAAKFYSNGTFVACNGNPGSLTEGIYKCMGDILYLSFGAHETPDGTIAYSDDITYQFDGTKFTSVEEYTSQNIPLHYSITPDPSATFETWYEFNKQENEDFESEITPSYRPLADGEYRVEIYADGSKTRGGRDYEIVGLLAYEEISDEKMQSIEIGDVIELHEFSITVESMQDLSTEDYKEIWFNDGQERCCYIEETGVWRFASPSDVPYTYVTEHISIPVAENAVLIDHFTALAIGRNVYGTPYDGSTDENAPIFTLNALSDFWNFHHFTYEFAILTVKNGEISKITIPYHP